jgi:hypothetical protein
MADVRRVIAGPSPRTPGEGTAAKLALLLAEGEGAAVERLSRTTLEDLCRGMRDGNGPRAGAEEQGSGDPAAPIPS